MVDKTEFVESGNHEDSQIQLERILSELRAISDENCSIIDDNRTFFNRLIMDQYMLNTFLKNIPVMVYFKDKESRFVKHSNSMLKRFNIAMNDSLIGKADLDIQDERHAKEAFKDEQKIIQTGEPIVEIIEKEKHVSGDRWVSTSKLPFKDSNGETIGVFGISRDVTELIRLQEELKQKNEALQKAEKLLVDQNIELEELNKTKDKFFSIIAHDLKSPLSSIVSYFDILSRRYDQISEDDRKRFINELAQTSSNTFALLEDLLNWSLSQRGKIKIHKEKLELKSLVDNQILSLKANAKQKEVSIKNLIAEGLEAKFDKTTMGIVFSNLINNAIKFTNCNGSIMLRAVQDSEGTKIEVIDNGVGMHENTLKNLFLLDKMESTLGTNNEMGTGLGLILCKDFVKKNGGELKIKSRKGIGTTIQILLPH